jgi:hypothetical protein
MFHFPGGGHPFHKGPAPHRHRRVSAWHSKGTAKGTVSLSVAVEVSTLQRTWTSADWYHRPVLEKDLWWSVEISRHGLTGGDSSAVLCKLKNDGHWNEMQRSILFCSSSWFYLTKIWLGHTGPQHRNTATICNVLAKLRVDRSSARHQSFNSGLVCLNTFIIKGCGNWFTAIHSDCSSRPRVPCCVRCIQTWPWEAR